MTVEFDPLRVYWLSGSPCAGKTTISSLLAQKNDWNVYHCDDWWDNHRQRASIDKHPHWYAYSRLTGDLLWLKDPQEHVAEAESAYDEEFDLILQDLAEILSQNQKNVIFDGYVSPRNLRRVLPSDSRAFYLVAAEKFQLEYYAQRPWIRDVLAKTSDPDRAWMNWMKRDSIGARMLEEELAQGDIPWLVVDGSITLEETMSRIATQFSEDNKQSVRTADRSDR